MGDAGVSTSFVESGRIVDLPFHVTGGLVVDVGSGASHNVPNSMISIGEITHRSGDRGVSVNVGPVGGNVVGRCHVFMMLICWAPVSA